MSTNRIDPRSQNARELRSAIKMMGPFDESLYDKLTKSREDGSMAVLRRVLDDEKEIRDRENKTRSLINRPIHVIVMNAFRVIREIIADLSEAKSIKDVSNALNSQGRSAYVGVLLSIISIIFLAVT